METALVVVRKGRAPELVLHGDAASAAAATAAVNIPVERPARVFRVVATNTVVAAPAADPGLPAPSGVLPEPAPAARPAATAPAPRRRRRVDVDKHPGPVKHILQPAAARIERAAEPAAETPVHGLSPGEEIAALQAAMARLDAVFDEISRARAFRVLG